MTRGFEGERPTLLPRELNRNLRDHFILIPNDELNDALAAHGISPEEHERMVAMREIDIENIFENPIFQTMHHIGNRRRNSEIHARMTTSMRELLAQSYASNMCQFFVSEFYALLLIQGQHKNARFLDSGMARDLELDREGSGGIFDQERVIGIEQKLYHRAVARHLRWRDQVLRETRSMGFEESMVDFHSFSHDRTDNEILGDWRQEFIRKYGIEP